MNSVESFYKLSYQLNNQGYSSYNDLRNLFYENRLDSIVEANVSIGLLKLDVTNYLNVLFDETIPFHYYKKLLLENATSKSRLYSTLFLIALYSGDENGYNNLPLLLLNLIKKLNIEKYRYVDINALKAAVYRSLDIKPNLKNQEDYCKVNHKLILNEDKYDKFDIKLASNTINFYDQDDFFIWAEHHAFESEKFNLPQYQNFIKWVSRYYGDGYGFDVLSFNSIKNIEKLIEVKSGRDESFTLTENECNVMRNCGFKNAEYYVYKYTYNLIANRIDTESFQYIPSDDILVDSKGQIHTLDEYQTRKTNGGYTKSFYIK